MRQKLCIEDSRERIGMGVSYDHHHKCPRLFSQAFRKEMRLYFQFIYLFAFGRAGSSLLCPGFLQLQQSGAPFQLWCFPIFVASCYRAHALGHSDFSTGDAQAQQLWLPGSRGRAQLSSGILNLLGLGIEPMCPALAGGFLTTGSPGKSCISVLLVLLLFIF